ncbi:hypothetical protein GCM10010172_18090 [Paractinoplanes ferrugineus]|uniref:Uncharacterized protein n=1 Tax=Paractinoplanes ferrugineus TaxID=113564 RepID=A0A919JCZ7_9ACTN|nr:hypothetical protein [Actinoplanes ferrugineus]GIE14901.1 hypothetical protein Afe05nite_67410 [Actinoplanes ferrugineus]
MAELHIGADAEKTVVSAYPLRTRTGRARRRRTGAVTEFLPVTPSGRSREIRLTFLARLSLPLVLVSAFMFAAGVPGWLVLTLAVATLGLAGWDDRRRAQRTTFRLPADSGARVLRTPEERAAYGRAVAVARRIRRTWPALPGMIDPESADRTLTHALDDLATLLVRRQEIRRLRAGLDGVRVQDVPAASPAALALTEQRARTEALWLASAEQANRILRSIDETAVAGEVFVREQRIGATARQAEATLARLTVGAAPAEAAPELAENTTVVLAAYRELAAAAELRV